MCWGVDVEQSEPTKSPLNSSLFVRFSFGIVEGEHSNLPPIPESDSSEVDALLLFMNLGDNLGCSAEGPFSYILLLITWPLLCSFCWVKGRSGFLRVSL